MSSSILSLVSCSPLTGTGVVPGSVPVPAAGVAPVTAGGTGFLSAAVTGLTAIAAENAAGNEAGTETMAAVMGFLLILIPIFSCR